MDVSTRASLSDAEIELIAGTKTKSNANGEVKIDTVPGGNYFVHVSKSGYEPITDTLAVKIQGELSPIALTTSRILELHKIGVKVNGRILIKTDRIKSTTLAAADVAVELRLIGNFQNPIRMVKTNKNGVFTFDSLPEFAEYLIRIPEFSMEGKKFNLNNLYANQSFSVGDDFTFPISILSPIDAGNFVVLSSLTTTLNPGKPLTIQFSNKVDTSSLQAGSITLSNSNFALAAEFSWSDDLTTLNIMPYHSDWSAGTRYLVTLNGLYDAQGQPLKNNPNQNLFTLSASLATPEPGSSKVSGLHVRASVYNPISRRNVDSNVVDYNTSSYQLIWNHLTGITSYELYSRDGADSVWRFENNIVTDTQVSIFSSTHLNKPFYRQHMVLPHSDKLNTNFNGADSITIKDGVKPTFGSSSTIAPLNSFYNALNNLLGTTKKIVSNEASPRIPWATPVIWQNHSGSNGLHPPAESLTLKSKQEKMDLTTPS